MMSRFPTTALALLLALAAAPTLAADAARGKEKAAVCSACHGSDGNSPSPEFPRIGGQHEQYLLRALLDYQLGRRKNPIMAAQVEKLSRQDLGDLAAYFASQRGLYLKR
jgi:cytochrome c553